MNMSLNLVSSEQSRVICNGAQSFMWAEYQYIGIFMAGFSVFILVVLGISGTGDHPWVNAVSTVIAFLVGSCTFVLDGYAGMVIGTFANARTALSLAISVFFSFVANERMLALHQHRSTKEPGFRLSNGFQGCRGHGMSITKCKMQNAKM